LDRFCGDNTETDLRVLRAQWRVHFELGEHMALRISMTAPTNVAIAPTKMDKRSKE